MIRGLPNFGLNDTKKRYQVPGCTTSAHRQSLVELLCNQIAYANFGDAAGLQPSAVNGNFYLSLHTADPGLNGNQDTNEVNYPGYARIVAVRDNAANNRLYPVTVASVGTGELVIAYPLNSIFGTTNWPVVGVTANKYVITHIGFGTALAGAGYLVGYGALTKPYPLKEGIGLDAVGGPWLLVL